MGRWRRTTACERAAQWISLELDDELEPLEQAALDRHVERCPGCAEARAGMGAFTALLRAAPPLPPRFPARIEPKRAPRRRRLRIAAAGLAFAAALGAGVVLFAAPAPGPVGTSVLAFATPRERLEFATAEHTRIELRSFAPPAPAPPRPAPPLVDRALLL